ncbi:histidine kinase, partial [Streptomyces sp. NPDC006265]
PVNIRASPAQPRGSDPAGSDAAASEIGPPHGLAVDEDVPPTGGADPDGDESREHERASDEEEDRVTDKGLPKRTPKITAPTTAPRQHSSSVDADALRRRLGGFRQGAQEGYRDVEAEIAERTASHQRPATGAAGPAEPEEATGGTVEEASS